LLGYPYGLTGKVVMGDRRGATLGFPTANITPNSLRKMIPARGVYVVAVEVGNRQMFGMMNIGIRPTVSAGLSETMEVHIFDFSGDIYGESIRITFLRRLRDEQRFSGVSELVAQLGRDREASMEFLSRLNATTFIHKP
jgi:riboflavin kinase/FMN adenylyltransferase